MGFRVMDRLVNIGDTGRPFHHSHTDGSYTGGWFPLEPSPPSPHENAESEMWSSRLLRWLGPVPRLYPYIESQIKINHYFTVTTSLSP